MNNYFTLVNLRNSAHAMEKSAFLKKLFGTRVKPLNFIERWKRRNAAKVLPYNPANVDAGAAFRQTSAKQGVDPILEKAVESYAPKTTLGLPAPSKNELATLANKGELATLANKGGLAPFVQEQAANAGRAFGRTTRMGAGAAEAAPAQRSILEALWSGLSSGARMTKDTFKAGVGGIMSISNNAAMAARGRRWVNESVDSLNRGAADVEDIRRLGESLSNSPRLRDRALGAMLRYSPATGAGATLAAPPAAGTGVGMAASYMMGDDSEPSAAPVAVNMRLNARPIAMATPAAPSFPVSAPTHSAPQLDLSKAQVIFGNLSPEERQILVRALLARGAM